MNITPPLLYFNNVIKVSATDFDLLPSMTIYTLNVL